MRNRSLGASEGRNIAPVCLRRLLHCVPHTVCGSRAMAEQQPQSLRFRAAAQAEELREEDRLRKSKHTPRVVFLFLFLLLFSFLYAYSFLSLLLPFQGPCLAGPSENGH